MFVCCLILYPSGNVDAFDGKREGLFLGVGIEPGITIDRTTYDFWEDSYLYGSPSLTTNFKIGYGLSEELLIYLISRPSLNGFYRYSFDDGNFNEGSDIYNDGTYGFGFMFFPNRSKNLYLSGCFGLATSLYLNEPDIEDLLIGLGVSGGIGLEISSNFAIEITLDYRRLTGQYDNTLDVVNFSFAFNMFLY